MFQQCAHRRLGKARLAGRLGVALDLFQRLVTGDGRDLLYGAANLDQKQSSGLSEPVQPLFQMLRD